MLELLTRQEAAAELRISTVTIDRIRKSGDLPYRQIGGQIRFLPQDLQLYLQNSTSGGLQRRKEVQNDPA